MSRVTDFVKDIMTFLEQHPEADLMFCGVSRVSEEEAASQLIVDGHADSLVIAGIASLQAALTMSIKGECGDCPGCQQRAEWIREALRAFPRDLVGSEINDDDAIGKTEGNA